MKEKEWELLLYETDYLNSGDDYWYRVYGFAVLRNKEGKLKVDTYDTVDYMEDGPINYLVENCVNGEGEDVKEFLNSIKVNEFIFNSPEGLFEAIDKDKIPIKRNLSVTGLIKYNTLNNLCKILDYTHILNKK